MSALYMVSPEDLEKDKSLKEFKERSNLSREECATVLEVFKSAIAEGNDLAGVSRVLVNSSGNVIFLKDGGEDLDLLTYLDGMWSEGSVNCANAKFLFPERLSYGVFDYGESTDDMDDDDDGATDLIDDNDELLLSRDRFLVYMKNGIRLPFTETGTIIGRSSAQSDFVIKGNGSLSKSHCKIYLEDGRAVIEDLNSSNGTYVNGKRVPKGGKQVVHPDDEVVLSHGNGEVFLVEL